MSLSYKQQQLMEIIDAGHNIKCYTGENGQCLNGIIGVNPIIYLTITFRSLLVRELIHVDDGNKVILTTKCMNCLNYERDKKSKKEIYVPLLSD